MTTGRINQVTDATRRREPSRRLHSDGAVQRRQPTTRWRAVGSNFDRHTLVGRESKTCHRRLETRSPPSRRLTSELEGIRRRAVVDDHCDACSLPQTPTCSAEHGATAHRQLDPTALAPTCGARACIRTETPRTKLIGQ